MKKIRENENRQFFVQSMEHERFARNWSIARMAEEVGLSKAAYYRIISNKSVCIPFRVVLHVHELTNLPMWQLCGMEMPKEFKYSMKYLKLTSDQRETIDALMDVLIEQNKNRST